MHKQHKARRNGREANQHPRQTVRFYGGVFFEMLPESADSYQYTYEKPDEAYRHVI